MSRLMLVDREDYKKLAAGRRGFEMTASVGSSCHLNGTAEVWAGKGTKPISCKVNPAARGSVTVSSRRVMVRITRK